MHGGERIVGYQRALDSAYSAPAWDELKELYDVEGSVHSVLEGSEKVTRDLLREFLEETRVLPPVSGGLVQ